MLAAAPGSSRCSGSGSFPAGARGCRPPALVDRVSRCFVVSLEVFDAWLPPRRRRRVAPPATTSKRVSGRRPRAARMSICAPSVAATRRRRRGLNHLARRMSASPRARARRKSGRGRRAAGAPGTTLTATRSPAAAVCDVFLEDLRRCCCRLSVASSSSLRPAPAPDPKTRRRLGPPSAPGRRSPCRRAPRRRRARRAVGPSGAGSAHLHPGAPAPGLANGRRSQNARGAVLARRARTRAWRPSARGARRPEAVAPPRSSSKRRRACARFCSFLGATIAARRRNPWTLRTSCIGQGLYENNVRRWRTLPHHRADAAAETTS